MLKTQTSTADSAGNCNDEAERTPDDRILASVAAALDRALPVPLGIQLRGLIEFGNALGDLPVGPRLLPVPDLVVVIRYPSMPVATVYWI